MWKVARYTTAAPLYFTAKDDYLDGGVLSNNPVMDAITHIQVDKKFSSLSLSLSLSFSFSLFHGNYVISTDISRPIIGRNMDASYQSL